ncbi:DNA replication/repair protein RecF [Chlamydiifrater phoenicopteri]|uniref:DNA replication/repair protein RecF n=1 Tax=Chlamydiifrater phoenicopteri TaxID=2681469 RepID=UPI001BCAFB15|nr:DNA replication/repair protein RecF [Chlamydiifrater phoenicopteri]
MRILNLRLWNFRNHSNTEIAFSPEINYLYGKNAQGKTNLLEAIYILCTGRSFRTPHLAEAVSFGKDSFYLEAEFEKKNFKHSLAFHFDKKGKKILCDDSPITTISSLIGRFPLILFAPNDIEIITGPPTKRRSFLNLLLAQSHPLYAKNLTAYTRSLQHRNALLRKKDTHTITFWEKQLASNGAKLITMRSAAIHSLNAYMQTLWQYPGKDSFILKFKSCAPKDILNKEDEVEAFLIELFKRTLEKDLEFGASSLGPHRDDFHILVDNKPAASFSSEGQKHSLLATLKLAEHKYLQQLSSLLPIICLDDLHAGLDSDRGNYLLSLLKGSGQQFITSTKSPQKLGILSNSYFVEDGSYTTAPQ